MRTIHVLRKPCSEGTVASNVLRHGTGAINVDGCRVAIHPISDKAQLRTINRSQRAFDDGWGMNSCESDRPQVVLLSGRWPANVLHDGSDKVFGVFPDTGTSTGGRIGNAGGAYINQGSSGWGTGHEKGDPGFGDSGSAGRYFQTVRYPIS